MQLILSEVSDPSLKFELSGQFIKLIYKGNAEDLLKHESFKLLVSVMHENSGNILQQMTPDDFIHLICLALIPKTSHADFVKEI